MKKLMNDRSEIMWQLEPFYSGGDDDIEEEGEEDYDEFKYYFSQVATFLNMEECWKSVTHLRLWNKRVFVMKAQILMSKIPSSTWFVNGTTRTKGTHTNNRYVERDL
jgi:hypothetical protein